VFPAWCIRLIRLELFVFIIRDKARAEGNTQ
jgi:hypothetical protein